MKLDEKHQLIIKEILEKTLLEIGSLKKHPDKIKEKELDEEKFQKLLEKLDEFENENFSLSTKLKEQEEINMNHEKKLHDVYETLNLKVNECQTLKAEVERLKYEVIKMFVLF